MNNAYPLLKRENILTDCQRAEKNDIIRKAGAMLVKSGYVDEDYVEGMIRREQTFCTNIGNGIGLPHGTDDCKQNVKHSGIVVLTFPNGTDWGGEDVKIVIGIAGVGDEHLDILANIAGALAMQTDVDRLVEGGDSEAIYRTFMNLN